MLWLALSACDWIDNFTDPTTIPDPTDTAVTTGTTYELIAGEVLTLGAGRTPGIDVVENRALVGWFEGTALFAGELPTIDPETVQMTDMGLASTQAGRPHFGYAEQRIIVAWDDGLGYGKVRSLLSTGPSQAELIVADTVDPGTFRIATLEDGSGVALWRDGQDMVTTTFDRLLTTTTSPEVVHGVSTGVFDGAPSGEGELLAAWSGPGLGESNSSTALRAATLPPPATPEAWDFIDQDHERVGEIALVSRDDGQPLLAWVAADGLYVRAPGLGEAVAIDGATVVGAPAVAWAGDIPVVVWQDDAALHVRAVGLPDGEDEVSFPSASSALGPDVAIRTLNGGTELDIMWEDAGSVRFTEVLLLVR